MHNVHFMAENTEDYAWLPSLRRRAFHRIFWIKRYIVLVYYTF